MAENKLLHSANADTTPPSRLFMSNETRAGGIFETPLASDTAAKHQLSYYVCSFHKIPAHMVI